jgi:excisionase family DNA binding protein
VTIQQTSSTLPADLAEALVEALSQALVNRYRKVHGDERTQPQPRQSETTSPTWLTVQEAARRARCGIKIVYREVVAGRLRAVRVGGRRSLRFRAEWIDEWLEAGGSAR